MKGTEMTEKTAVVIDDEVDLTNYISSILEEHGFRVFAANEATTGEALIREKMPLYLLMKKLFVEETISPGGH